MFGVLITFDVGSYNNVYLGNDNACNIDGIGTIHLSLNYGQEYMLNDVRYVTGFKNSLLFVGQISLHGYTTPSGGRLWKLKKVLWLF
jgi:hypothetical protein